MMKTGHAAESQPVFFFSRVDHQQDHCQFLSTLCLKMPALTHTASKIDSLNKVQSVRRTARRTSGSNYMLIYPA
ncbi:hypothetical protein BTW08_06815 [Salinicola sp. MH3R3-1]|nr:hypothetical protein BTW08_06815 [Salinicola sp. MH3R3-1]